MNLGLLSPKRVIALVLTLVVIAGVVVASLWLDKKVDRRRPMYRALIEMVDLQYDLLKAGKPAQDVVLRHGGRSYMIKGSKFTLPHGVTVKVAQRSGSTCVFAKNRHGDKSSWQCIDLTSPRPSLGGLQ